jgi:hypothetical protein
LRVGGNTTDSKKRGDPKADPKQQKEKQGRKARPANSVKAKACQFLSHATDRHAPRGRRGESWSPSLARRRSPSRVSRKTAACSASGLRGRGGIQDDLRNLIRPAPAVLDQMLSRIIPPPDCLHDLGLAPFLEEPEYDDAYGDRGQRGSACDACDACDDDDKQVTRETSRRVLHAKLRG